MIPIPRRSPSKHVFSRNCRQINQLLGKKTAQERSLTMKAEQRGTICPNLLGILRKSSATSL